MAVVWTIGHSTHPIERFLELLKGQGIQILADIRRFPTSRWPQFKQEALKGSLAAAGIEYVHVAKLGGYRRGGYEEHTKTPEFTAGLEELVALASTGRTAIMCAESVFFRCHRRYVADALVAGGHKAIHIFPDGRTQVHALRGRIDGYT